MKTLMHTCCAPCSVSCIQQLRAEGIPLTATACVLPTVPRPMRDAVSYSLFR